MPIPDATPAPQPGQPSGPASSAAPSTSPGVSARPPTIPAPAPSTPPLPREQFQPAALILALILPGLGHFSLGETRRAIGIAAGILGLFVSGLFIGGIDCVDRRENPVWFIGQALVGPVALATDWVHQSQLKVIDPRTSQLRSPLPNEVRGPGAIAQPAKPGERPPYSKSLGKMNELGTLFCAIAGMINLIAIVDVAYHRPRRAPRAASTTRGPRP